MKVLIRTIDSGIHCRTCSMPAVAVWPEGLPVPRVGEAIELGDGTRLTVKAVDWYPQGVEGNPEPTVYVVAQ